MEAFPFEKFLVKKQMVQRATETKLLQNRQNNI